MNSGTTSTKLNDMLTEFVDYVYSFYGDKKDALYPLFNVDTDKQVDKIDILGAVYDYLHEITRRNDDHFTWWIQLGDNKMTVKGLNIDVTRGQYMMLYNIMCEHNQMVNPESNPDFDLQTFDNLFQAITMAKETYLSWQQKQKQPKNLLLK